MKSVLSKVRPSDLRGAARLAIDATTGLTDLVEALHERIARLPGVPAPVAAGRTGGIIGLVYRSVRGVTRGVGLGVDGLLGLLTPLLGPAAQAHASERSPERDAVLAALNGVLGDYLVQTGNPLATAMAVRQGDFPSRPLVMAAPGSPSDGNAALAASPGADRRRRVLLVHGLCMNDRQWLREGHDHGAALARDIGCVPLYLRYNTGLHVSTNGRALADLLEAQWQAQPDAPLAIVGHSMGGLVARSAVHVALQAGHRWPQQLGDLVFLGTPHHGAPLERAGHGVDRLLSATPYAAPFARLGKLRSAGITDLRHGNLLDGDWAGHDRFSRHADHRTPVPLPEGVRCSAVAASLAPQAGALRERWLGDGLVPVNSALGRHADPARCLAFAADRCCVVQGLGHLDLLSSPEVYQHLLRWLR